MEKKIHKNGCLANTNCLVLHLDGVCPGLYGKCTCNEIVETIESLEFYSKKNPMTNEHKEIVKENK